MILLRIIALNGSYFGRFVFFFSLYGMKELFYKGFFFVGFLWLFKA